MFHRIQQYPLMTAEGRTYRPRAYGEPRPDESWDGWLVFFPIDGGSAIASDRETTESSYHALSGWASSLNHADLAGGLERAIRIAEQPSMLASLARAKYQALADADQLEHAAEAERLAATADETVAADARNEANEIHRERLVTEQALAAAEATAANMEAITHEHDAATARRAAAARRRRQRTNVKRKRSA
jgi:hypothetical protein